MDTPQLLARGGVQGNQTPVDGSDKNAAFPERNATVDHIAAGFDPARFVDFGIEAPQWFAGFGVIRKYFGPGGRDKHFAVDNHWRCLLAARIWQVSEPGNAQILHIAIVNQGKRAVPLLIIIEASHRPV